MSTLCHTRGGCIARYAQTDLGHASEALIHSHDPDRLTLDNMVAMALHFCRLYNTPFMKNAIFR